MPDIQSQLGDLIQRKTGQRPQANDSFETLQLDSLGMAELTVEIEQAFGIRVSEDVTDVTDMAGLIAYIEARQAHRPTA